MKSLKLLFLSVFFFSFVMSSNAQSVADKYEWDEVVSVPWQIMVECDGVVDYIYGNVQVHRVYHINPETGLIDWHKHSRKDIDLQSLTTGEKFKMNYTRKINVHEGHLESIGYHVNLRGDAGSHIIYSIVEEFDHDTDTWIVVREKAVCK